MSLSHIIMTLRQPALVHVLIMPSAWLESNNKYQCLSHWIDIDSKYVRPNEHQLTNIDQHSLQQQYFLCPLLSFIAGALFWQHLM